MAAALVAVALVLRPVARAESARFKRNEAEPWSMCATTSTCDCEIYSDRKHRSKDDNLF